MLNGFSKLISPICCPVIEKIKIFPFFFPIKIFLLSGENSTKANPFSTKLYHS